MYNEERTADVQEGFYKGLMSEAVATATTRY